jgi:hypothetical protein
MGYGPAAVGAGAFFLLFVVIVVAAGVALFFYLGGAAMWKKQTDPDPDAGGDPSRPQHVVTGPASNARMAPSVDGTGDRDEIRGES